MNHHYNFAKKLNNITACAIFVIFILICFNSLLPLKWRFPSWKLSLHLTSMNTDTAEGSRSDYINSNNDITVALDKNYATVLKTLDENGNCILEQYFDNHGKPAVLISGHSAIRKEYNEDGQWITTTYLDSELRPTVNRYGYSSIHRTYANKELTVTDMYYDENGLPTLDNYKRYGARYEYNEKNQIAVITSLDAGQNAMNNSYHYSISKRAYTTEGKLHTEMFYDKDGTPARLGYGQYGYLYENGRPICLDQNGHKLFIARHFLLHSVFAVLLIGIILVFLILLSNRKLTLILLLSYLSFIAYMTIIDREVGISIVKWSLPPNYYLFFTDREILANIWLFIPLGAILYKLSHVWKMIFFSTALSLIIEILQLTFDIGAFELADLIANSLGGVLGIMVCYTLEPLVNKSWNKLLNRFG